MKKPVNFRSPTLNSQLSILNSKQGQVALVLALVIMVATTIGIGIAQRSFSGVANSTRTEQSSRAFSAAEAGIEQAISTQTLSSSLSLGNKSKADFLTSQYLPGANQALGIPHTNKSEFAQFWLANPDDLTNFYNPTSIPKQIDIYFGNGKNAGNNKLTPGISDKPAIEANLILKDPSGKYYAQRKFYDSDSLRSTRAGNFTTQDGTGFVCNDTGTSTSTTIPGFVPSDNITIDDPEYYCRVRLSYPDTPDNSIPPTVVAVMLRVRILYSNGDQAVAIAPPSPCSGSCSIPPQIKVYTSTGTSGDSQRTLKVYESKKNLPTFLDFVLLSAGTITKGNP